MAKKMRKRTMRLPPRDRLGRFMKPKPRPKRKRVSAGTKSMMHPALSVHKTVHVGGGRVFVQRYFIDKFKRGNKTEYEVWTVSSKGTPPLASRKQVLDKVKSIV